MRSKTGRLIVAGLVAATPMVLPGQRQRLGGGGRVVPPACRDLPSQAVLRRRRRRRGRGHRGRGGRSLAAGLRGASAHGRCHGPRPSPSRGRPARRWRARHGLAAGRQVARGERRPVLPGRCHVVPPGVREQRRLLHGRPDAVSAERPRQHPAAERQLTVNAGSEAVAMEFQEM